MRFDRLLYNRCHDVIASRKYWQTRDFDARFDREVETLYFKVLKMLDLTDNEARNYA